MVGHASSASTRAHRWDAKGSVAGTVHAPPRSPGGPKRRPPWKGAGDGFADPNARTAGKAAHATDGSGFRFLDVYEATLRDVDEMMGVPVDEWSPALGASPDALTYRGAPRYWPGEATSPRPRGHCQKKPSFDAGLSELGGRRRLFDGPDARDGPRLVVVPELPRDDSVDAGRPPVRAGTRRATAAAATRAATSARRRPSPARRSRARRRPRGRGRSWSASSRRRYEAARAERRAKSGARRASRPPPRRRDTRKRRGTRTGS